MAKKELYERYVQCFSVRNLYIDTEENKTRTMGLLDYINDWSLKYDNKITYAYILHDNDYYRENVFDDYDNLIGSIGDLKKAHYHIYIKLPYPVQLGDLAIKLNLELDEIDYFEPKHYRNKILYLTHICHQDKYQYKVSEIVTNKQEFINSIYSAYQPILDCINETLLYIESNKRYVEYREIINFLNSLGIKSNEIGKKWYILKSLIDEHNKLHNYVQKIDDDIEKKYIKKYSMLIKDNDKLSKLLKQFDKLDIVDENGQTTTLMKVSQ